MQRFLQTSVLFFAPAVIWAVIVVVVDPFNYFGISSVVDDETKILNAEKLNSLLFRSVEYTRSPSAYMLIGDSRTKLLPLDEIESVSGTAYGSLCTNATKMNEIFDLIYMVHERVNLEHVVVGLNFNMFNKYGYADRVTSLRKVLDNPLKYIYNKSVAEVCYYTVRAALTGTNVSTEPPMDREQFWEWNIQTKATHWYGKFDYPESLYADLTALDNFAQENGIRLTFIVVPHQREFHDRLVQFGLSDEEARFKEYMGGLDAMVIDFDFDNEITRHKENFTDPVHYNSDVARRIVREVWMGDLESGRSLSP